MKGILRCESEYEKRFANDFKQLCRKHSSWTVWKDFVDTATYAISNAVDRRSKVWQKREDAYLEIAKRYDKDELDILCNLFVDTVLALEENPAQDFLGKLYMALDFGDGWTGQFFTPWSVSEFMAKITIGGDLKKQIDEAGYISVCDNACGAGCMLIAFANACKDIPDVNYQQDVVFVAQDIDDTVAKMCYIQLSLLGCAGYVVVGNTITEPTTGTVLHPIYKGDKIYFTPMWFTNNWTIKRLMEDNCKEPSCKQEDAPQSEKSEQKTPIVKPVSKSQNQQKSDWKTSKILKSFKRFFS
jgi:type I restriction-modification system DNA methylase subunit